MKLLARYFIAMVILSFITTLLVFDVSYLFAPLYAALLWLSIKFGFDAADKYLEEDWS